ncbi:hypothetical protein EJ110_NYTH58442 [Nymphaea thermarum]|nr:hypothetical protein EJ110_NYTH58442 [Nymphaea thermarum]
MDQGLRTAASSGVWRLQRSMKEYPTSKLKKIGAFLLKNKKVERLVSSREGCTRLGNQAKAASDPLLAREKGGPLPAASRHPLPTSVKTIGARFYFQARVSYASISSRLHPLLVAALPEDWNSPRGPLLNIAKLALVGSPKEILALGSRLVGIGHSSRAPNNWYQSHLEVKSGLYVHLALKFQRQPAVEDRFDRQNLSGYQSGGKTELVRRLPEVGSSSNLSSMDIFLSTYENGVCVRRVWLVRGANWEQGSNWILVDVGTSSYCDIVISHPSVMHRHFMIDIEKETLDMWVNSLTGMGKLRVRGKEVKPYSKRQIYPGDVIQVGTMSSWMRIEAASWPEQKIPTIIETESDTEYNDDSGTSSQTESTESTSDEEELYSKKAKSSRPPTIGELAQKMLERVDQMIEANKSRKSIFSDSEHPSTNQRSKKGVLGSESKYFPYGIPSENQPNEAEFKVTAGLPSAETQEGLLATPPPTTTIDSDKSSEEVMSEKKKSFPPPRRTGIAKVYRQFYSSKMPMMPEPRVTQANVVREKDKSLLPLPEQTSEPWTEQEIYEEIKRLCQSSEGHIDVEPKESSTNNIEESTLDDLTSKTQPKEGGVDRTLILTHRSRARKELQSKATQELMSPNLKALIALNKKSPNKPGLGQRNKPLTIPELLEEEVLATSDGILPESESDSMRSSEGHHVEAKVYPNNQKGEQQHGKIDLDTLNVQTGSCEIQGYQVATPTSSQGKTYPKEGGHHKFQAITLGHYIEKLYPERWRAYQFPDSPNCSRELRDSYSTPRTHVHSPRRTSAAGAQWVMNNVRETTKDTVLRTPHRGKELQEQKRLFIGRLPRDYGPGQQQRESLEAKGRTTRLYPKVYNRGPRGCFLHMRNSLEVLPRDYGPTEKHKWVAIEKQNHPLNGIARAWGQAHFKEGGLLRAPNPARSVRTKPRAKVGLSGLVRAGNVFTRADGQAREVKKPLGVIAEGGAGGKSNNGQVHETQFEPRGSGPSLGFTLLVNQRSPSFPSLFSHSFSPIRPTDQGLRTAASSGVWRLQRSTKDYPTSKLKKISAFLLKNKKVERLVSSREGSTRLGNQAKAASDPLLAREKALEGSPHTQRDPSSGSLLLPPLPRPGGPLPAASRHPLPTSVKTIGARFYFLARVSYAAISSRLHPLLVAALPEDWNSPRRPLLNIAKLALVGSPQEILALGSQLIGIGRSSRAPNRTPRALPRDSMHCRPRGRAGPRDSVHCLLRDSMHYRPRCKAGPRDSVHCLLRDNMHYRPRCKAGPRDSVHCRPRARQGRGTACTAGRGARQGRGTACTAGRWQGKAEGQRALQAEGLGRAEGQRALAAAYNP